MKSLDRVLSLAFLLTGVFLLDARAAAQTQPSTRVVAQFDGKDGANPVSQLIQLPNGELLGVSLSAQYHPKALSSIYLLTKTGAIQPIYQLASDGSQGSYFGSGYGNDGIVQASDGDIYGVMSYDGKKGEGPGLVYRFTLPSTFTKLHEFSSDSSDCAEPEGSMVQGVDGYLYGICAIGGLYGTGAIFRVGLSGSYQKIYDFGQDSVGISPYFGLTEGPNGRIFGVTYVSYVGGSEVSGSLFELDPATLTVSVFAYTGNQDGFGSLPAFDANGDVEILAGATCSGCGAQLVRYDAGGAPIIEFTLLTSQFPEGEASLFEVAPGVFLISGGPTEVLDVNQGSVTQIPIDSQLYNFGPIGNFTETNGGNLLATYFGSLRSPFFGAVVEISGGYPVPLPVVNGFFPASASQGETVSVIGSNYVGAASVKIGEVNVPFSVKGSGAITFAAPVGPISGQISVTTAGGTAVSAQMLTVN